MSLLGRLCGLGGVRGFRVSVRVVLGYLGLVLFVALVLLVGVCVFVVLWGWVGIADGFCANFVRGCVRGMGWWVWG